MEAIQEELRTIQMAVYSGTLLDTTPNIYQYVLDAEGSLPVVSQLVLGNGSASAAPDSSSSSSTSSSSHSSYFSSSSAAAAAAGEGGEVRAVEGKATERARLVLDASVMPAGSTAVLKYLHPPGSQVRPCTFLVQGGKPTDMRPDGKRNFSCLLR